MNCCIPGNNLKVINRAITALHRLSDEVHIDCSPENLSLIALNANKTTYAKFIFETSFFQTYHIETNGNQDKSRKVTCKILLKGLLNVFKQITAKRIDTSRIELSEYENIMIIKMFYKSGLSCVHGLKFLDTDYLTFNYNVDDTFSIISASGEVFNMLLSNFQLTDHNLSLEICDTKTVFRNYDMGEPNSLNVIRSQLSISRSEFLIYNVRRDTSIVLSLKAVRSAIQFAESCGLNVELYFKEGGTPLILRLKSTCYAVDFVIATIGPDNLTTQATSAVDCRTVVSKKDLRANNKATTTLNNQIMSFSSSASAVSGASNPVTKIIDDLGDSYRDESTHQNHQKSINMSDGQDDSWDEVREAKMLRIFGRCFEPSFHVSRMDFSEIWAPDSDPEADN